MPSLYIDGAWVHSGDGDVQPVINPSDATTITEVESRPTPRSNRRSPRPAARSRDGMAADAHR